MKKTEPNAAAVICEYNPFHNGHRYLIDTAKERSGGAFLIAVMSGNYVQRGEPAAVDKWTRCRAALQCGVDAVVEIPSVYAAASAQFFAEAAVDILNRLGIVRTLFFGSECGDTALLTRVAGQKAFPSGAFTERLRELLRSGLAYPAAMQEALGLDALLPNDILGTEYIRALLLTESPVSAYAVKRVGSVPHAETDLPAQTEQAQPQERAPLSAQDIPGTAPRYTSAAALRAFLCSRQAAADARSAAAGAGGAAAGARSAAAEPAATGIAATGSTATAGAAFPEDDPTLSAVLRTYMPEPAAECLLRRLSAQGGPVTLDAFSSILFALLRMQGPEGIRELPFVTEGLENLLYAEGCKAQTLPELIENCTGARYTRTRITRILTCLLTGARRGDFPRGSAGADEPAARTLQVPYLRILGIKSTAKPLLSAISAAAAKTETPFFVGALPAKPDALSGRAAAAIRREARATDLYTLGIRNPALRRAGLEYTEPLIVL